MNFFYLRLIRKSTLLTTFLVLNSIIYSTFAIGNNIDIKSFSLTKPITQITQASDGLLYLANENSVIVFDGYFWNNVGNGKNPKLVNYNNSILVFFDDQIGFINRDIDGKPIISKILGNEDLIDVNIENILQLIPYQNKIFYSTNNSISVFNDSFSFKKLLKSKKIINVTNTESTLIIHTPDSIVTISKKSDSIVNCKPNNKGFYSMISCRNSYISVPIEKNLNNSEIEKVLIDNNLRLQSKLNDSLSVVVTNDRIIIYNTKTGRLFTTYNDFDNEPINTITKIFCDKNERLWCFNNYKMGVIDIFEPFKLMSLPQNSPEITDIITVDNETFVLSKNEIFKLNNNVFQRIQIPTLSIKSIFNYNNSIAFANDSNLFYYSDNKTLNRINSPTKKLKHISSTEKEELLIITSDSIIWFNVQQKKISNYYLFKASINNYIIKDTLIYVSATDNKIYKITREQKTEINHNDSFHKNNIQFVTDKGKVFAISSNIAYSLEDGNPENINNIISDKNGLLLNFKEDKHNNKWVLTQPNSELTTVLSVYWNDSLTAKRILPQLEINKIFITQNDGVWITTNDKLIKFNNRSKNKLHNQIIPSINKIKINDTIAYYGSNTSFDKETNKFISGNKFSIKKDDEIVFYFNGNSSKSSNLMYQYIIEGKRSFYSKWFVGNEATLNMLNAGEYIFKIRSINNVGQMSDFNYFSFTVLPYFYETKTSKTLAIIFLALLLTVIYFFTKYRQSIEQLKLTDVISERTELLIKEKEQFDNLITQVLPTDTANELAFTGKTSTRKYNRVTVLFSDIQGFTRITDEMNPEQLIDKLDHFFLHFDEVIEKYNIEKIKTIGDAYMCAGGIPEKNHTNPVEMVLAAIEMQQYMTHISKESKIWDIRIGIDTGPVIAGVIGRKKMSYDIWGATVNTASRMESSGEADKINITSNTYMLIRNYFNCTYRGKMPVKNKGEIDMYFVDGIKPNLSKNNLGLEPNEDFITMLQTLRLSDLEEFVMNKLDKGLPKNLYYHNLKHTVDVYTQVELIGREEGLTKEELLIIRTAGLLHDAGHLIDYDTHEEMGVKLAQEILLKFQYTQKQIDQICEIIMATKMPPKPKNLMEKIICDADLDYLGRSDFLPVSNLLYKELNERGKVSTLKDWNKLQLKFITSHQYFTKTAASLREVNKQEQLEKIREIVE